MRNAAVEQLSKILSDAANDANNSREFRSRRPIEFHFSLAEGWFSFFLLATIVYTTIWSVQAAGWVDHMSVLSFTTALGLGIGVVTAKQQRFSRWLVHGVVVVFGLLLAFWQAASAFYGGDSGAFAQGIERWFTILFGGGTGDDDAIFLFLIVALGFILAYSSVWLVYRLRSPWLAIVANAIVFLINLSAVNSGYIILLPVFLLAALLLLLRFNLYESTKRWERQGLRYPDDLGWDVMQAGVLISIGILILSWILPSTYVNPVASQIWNVKANPLVQLENTWNRVISLNSGANPANHGSFRDTLALGGNPNLTNEVVYTLQTDDAHAPYLAFVAYDTYDNKQWTINGQSVTSDPIPANTSFSASATSTHLVKQTITVVNPPAEQYPYIIGAYEITSMNQSARFLLDSRGRVIAWLGKDGNMPAGTTYTVTSALSSADVKTLQSVPLPKDAPPYRSGPVVPGEAEAAAPPVTAFEPTILQSFTQMPGDKALDAFLHTKAQEIVTQAHATTMYDMAVALETSFRNNNFTYNVDIKPPAGEDPVYWFLHDSHQGFCNYFASSMTLLARSLGMPARVVAGYSVSSADYDQAQKKYVIRGKSAHTWTQIYFAGYGWVDFEPSVGFSTFTRPVQNQYPTTSPSGSKGSTTGDDTTTAARKLRFPTGNKGSVQGNGNGATNTPLEVGRDLGLAVASLIVLGLFGLLLFAIWWRRLFRRYSLAAQLYGRVCTLANFAGIRMQPSQTPYEYLQDLSVSALPASSDAAALERLGDIYVRERWADPHSKEHPSSSGELSELPGIWQRLQPRLFFYVLRHPYFLRWLPALVQRRLKDVRQRWRRRRMSEMDGVDF